MITYQKGYCGVFLLFRFAGTSWYAGILPGLISATIGFAIGSSSELNGLIIDESRFIDNPYPFQLFAYLVGFVTVFRTNFAYQRYWESMDAVQRMGAKWLDGACMAIAFDAPGDASTPYLSESIPPRLDEGGGQSPVSPSSDAAGRGVSHMDFFVQIVHLFSLLHALSLQHLRCDEDLDNIENPVDQTAAVMRLTSLNQVSKLGKRTIPSTESYKAMVASFDKNDRHFKHKCNKLYVLGGVTKEERARLDLDGNNQPVPSLTRVTMVESWIMRRLIARQKHEGASGDSAKTSPPILSRLYQVVSDGTLAFSQACKASEIPFPFPYHNIMQVFLWAYALSVPYVLNSQLFNPVLRFAINFLAVFSYFALNQVGDNLEDPYMPYDPNDLPLLAIQHSYNSRLLSFGVVPDPSPDEAELTEISGGSNGPTNGA